jgi:hypothetical protein
MGLQAPEQLIGLKCTAKADVYSYGLGELSCQHCAASCSSSSQAAAAAALVIVQHCGALCSIVQHCAAF